LFRKDQLVSKKIITPTTYDKIKDQIIAKQMNSFGWLDSLAQDVRYAFRGMRRSPGFTIVAVMTLALGIAVNATVFTVTNAMLFKGFPSVDPDNRLLYIDSRKGTACCVSFPDFEDWRAQAKSFEGMAVVSNGGLRIRVRDGSGLPEIYDATRLSANAFSVLDQRPILGRDFAPSDEAPGAAPVTILSYGLWVRRYGKDPGIIGRILRIDDTPTTVIGVMARGFDFPHHRVDLWMPLRPPSDLLQQRQTRVLWFAFGRVAEGVTIKSARAEMDTIGKRLSSAYPLSNQDIVPVVKNFTEFFVGPDATAIYGSMSGAVGFVLLIACANLANLLLGRAVVRSREMSVRIALGAGRWRIIRQLLVESVMLSAVGGVLGWLITTWSVRIYELVASPPNSYNQWHYAMDYRVFAYLVGISIGTGLLFGLAPARRLSKLDVNATLKDGGHGAAGGRRGRHVSGLLVVGEMALAVVLLVGAGVMIRSFLNIYTADLGVQTTNILTASVTLPPSRYPRADAPIAFFDRLAAHLEALPGVESIALASSLPGLHTSDVAYELAGAPPVDEQHRPTVLTVVISPGYFRTVEAHVLSGRAFNDVDEPSGVPVAIVNERFASRTWPGEDPLGKRVRLFDGKTPDAWRTVVGVASNIVQKDTTGQTLDPVVYVPFRQKPGRGMAIIGRTRIAAESLVTTFRREIQAIDADLVIGSGLGSIEGPKVLTKSLAFEHWSNAMNATLFLIFAATALLLASVGLYAVVAHAVSRRTQEIGIRTAMGATAPDIFMLVFKQGMLPVGIGLTVGLPAALAVTPLLKSQLVGVSPADPLTIVAASATLVVSATLGCLIPAHRAMRVDPVVALRHE
jgi:putative ABC transport system permease protein